MHPLRGRHHGIDEEECDCSKPMGDLGEKHASARMTDHNGLRSEISPGIDCGFDESLPSGWLRGAGDRQVRDRDRMAGFGRHLPEGAPAGGSEQRAMDEQEALASHRHYV